MMLHGLIDVLDVHENHISVPLMDLVSEIIEIYESKYDTELEEDITVL